MKSIILAAALALPLQGDEQTMQLQTSLKDSGFYYGQVDGQAGDETAAAVRRFQIRNGLNVTGKADAATLAALKLGPQVPASTAAAPARKSSEPAFLGPNSTKNSQPQPTPFPVESKPFAVSPPRENSPTLRAFFRKTEYDDVPAEEQSVRLNRAQAQLHQLGYLRTAPDGNPSLETSAALAAFQRNSRLRASGFLDARTTLALNQAVEAEADSVQRSEKKNAQPPHSFRGIWVH